MLWLRKTRPYRELHVHVHTIRTLTSYTQYIHSVYYVEARSITRARKKRAVSRERRTHTHITAAVIQINVPTKTRTQHYRVQTTVGVAYTRKHRRNKKSPRRPSCACVAAAMSAQPCARLCLFLCLCVCVCGDVELHGVDFYYYIYEH